MKEERTRCRHADRMKIIFLLALLLIKESEVDSIDCYVGYGQEGREHTEGIEWPRKCPQTDYCFKVVTNDINKIKSLLDYSWVRTSAHLEEHHIRFHCFITFLINREYSEFPDK